MAKILVADDEADLQILINNIAYEKVKESFNCKIVGEVSLKHKADQVTVYEVLD